MLTRRRLLAAGIAVPALISFGAAGYSLSRERELNLKSLRAAEGQSLTATLAAMGNRAGPSDWPASVFLSTSVLQEALRGVVGLRAVFNEGRLWRDSSLTITRASASTAAGVIGLEMSLSAEAPKLGAALDLSMKAIVRFAGFDRDDDRKLHATFAIEPISIGPSARLGLIEVRSSVFWSELFASLLPSFFSAKALPLVRIPLPERIEIPFSFPEREAVEKTGGGTVTLKTRQRDTATVAATLAYGPPVMTAHGVWLLANVGDTPTALVSRAADASAAPADLTQLRRDLEAKTPAFDQKSVNDGVCVRIGRAGMAHIADRIGRLHENVRTLQVRATNVNGPLAVYDQHGVLGHMRFSVDLHGDDPVQFDMVLDPPSLTWREGAPMLALPVHASLKAALKLHGDIGPGGGVGTTVGVVGASRSVLYLSALPKIVHSGAGNLLLLEIQSERTTIDARATTDGVLKTALGSASVPKLGVRMIATSDAGTLARVPMLDHRPVVIPIQARRSGSWKIASASEALIIRLQPRAIESAGDHIAISAGLEFERVSQPLQTARERAQAESAAIDEAIRLASITRPPPIALKFAALLGDIEIGENNEIVKLIRAVSERIEREFNAKKLAEWRSRPIESLRRSDLNPVNAVSRGVRSIGRRFGRR